MFLVDTNIWLERLLEQVRSEEVGQFLEQIPSDQLLITDFSFHSIGVILNRLCRQEDFLRFVQDVLIDGAVQLVSLQPTEMQRLVAIMNTYQLDFDDAYQYVASEKYDVVLVSFDSDFDATECGRKTPVEVLEADYENHL